jgi:mono/diheme cytochrome c family protein
LSRLSLRTQGAKRLVLRNTRLALVLAIPLLGTGCWEQWSVTWWPQMKWQKAVQAFGETGMASAKGGFVPPEGTVPIDSVRKVSEMTPAESEAQPNPKSATLATLENGKKQFEIFCSPCHGLQGLADGLVAGPPFGKGPFVGVLPIAGPVGGQITKNFTDGHIYTVISQGIRRMPAYRRIPPDHRWDIVNYVRYMNGQLPVAGTQMAQAQAPAPEGGASP